MVESYFKQLDIEGGEKTVEISPRIKRLSGIAPIKLKSRSEKTYADYLLNKYYKQ
jgi:hypothetical protein